MSQHPDAERPGPIAAWTRAHARLDRLFDALADLDEAGGVPEAATLAGWTTRDLDRAAGRLRLVRDMLDAELGRIRHARGGWR